MPEDEPFTIHGTLDDGRTVRLERFGTYLDPAAYGLDHDHHTLTNQATVPGQCVALYRIAEVPDAD